MFNFLKPNKNETTSRKSFEKMQQLLFDADSYMKSGHKDVAKALLHELVREAERNTDQIAEEIFAPIMPAIDYGRIQEVEFENTAHVSGKSNLERIQQGECISDRGTDHCGHCVDHCEASDYRKKQYQTPEFKAQEVETRQNFSHE